MSNGADAKHWKLEPRYGRHGTPHGYDIRFFPFDEE